MSMTLTVQEWHKREAVTNFNETWSLIDKTDRTEEETLSMIHKAHASRYHWAQIGTPLELARGEWQVSRVYSLIGLGESALHHAWASLKYCQDNNYGDFDLAFAYEAIARAYKVLDNDLEKEKYLELARQAAEQIAEDDNQTYFLSELSTI